jgi:hypothetical protein
MQSSNIMPSATSSKINQYYLELLIAEVNISHILHNSQAKVD